MLLTAPLKLYIYWCWSPTAGQGSRVVIVSWTLNGFTLPSITFELYLHPQPDISFLDHWCPPPPHASPPVSPTPWGPSHIHLGHWGRLSLVSHDQTCLTISSNSPRLLLPSTAILPLPWAPGWRVGIISWSRNGRTLPFASSTRHFLCWSLSNKVSFFLPLPPGVGCKCYLWSQPKALPKEVVRPNRSLVTSQHMNIQYLQFDTRESR